MLPKRPAGQDVYTLAMERTASVLARFDRVFVLFSGGKDSTATLNVILDVAHSDPKYARHLPLRTVFQDEEAIPVETEEYVRRIAARDDINCEWYCLPVKHRNACSRTHPWWYPWAPEDKHKWCRPLPPEAITELPGFPIWPVESRLTTAEMNGLLAPVERGNTAIFMGIRAQESLTRRRAVTARKIDNYLVKSDDGTSQGNLWKAYPVYDWTTEDVWTAPAVKGWDYNRAYDRMEMAGVSHSIQRCSPAFGEEPLQKIHTYAACFPDVWSKMTERVPGVGAAVRYARTELYSYHGRPAKPPGLAWPDFIGHYLRQFRPGDAATIAGKIKLLLARHYQMTADPIVVHAPHPDTCLSWDWLLMLAMRGDFKSRKHAGGRILNDAQRRPLPGYWHKYADELHQIMIDGTYAELAAPVPPPADPYSLIPPYAWAAGRAGVSPPARP